VDAAKLKWKIQVDDDDDGYLWACEGPFELNIIQPDDTRFWWYVYKHDSKDADKDPVDAAKDTTPSLIAAMAAAQAAVMAAGQFRPPKWPAGFPGRAWGRPSADILARAG
jgi:hypothetical protein